MAKKIQKRSEGMKQKCNAEKPDFCKEKSQTKNKNSKLDICPNLLLTLKPYILGKCKDGIAFLGYKIHRTCKMFSI